MAKWMALFILGLGGLAQADTVIKCISPEGKLTWTNRSCADGDRMSTLSVEPQVADSSGLRDWARRNPARAGATSVAKAGKPQPFINPVDCENARRGYAFELGWKFRKADQLAYRRKEVCRNCGECP